MSASITVIDYGIGNLHSVVKALRHVGGEVRVSADPADILSANHLVLPGVGAFGDGIRQLRSRGLVEPLLRHVEADRPLLGICLGMQLLLSESHEFGVHEGLGIIPGKVVPIPGGLGVKVPQIGWNWITPGPEASWRGSILEDAAPRAIVYFVHSFSAAPDVEAHRLADADYGGFRVAAAVAVRNVVGCQFHPEKSGPVGLSMLRRFLAQ